MTQPLENGEQPYKREHIGPKESFPSDPGEILVFLVSTGETLEEQKEWIAFVSSQINSAGFGVRLPSRTEIRERWMVLKQKKGAQSDTPTVLDLPSGESI